MIAQILFAVGIRHAVPTDFDKNEFKLLTRSCYRRRMRTKRNQGAQGCESGVALGAGLGRHHLPIIGYPAHSPRLCFPNAIDDAENDVGHPPKPPK